jgi:prepilin-type N-terminal cleavage/methylation domain-containing protein
MTTKRGFTLVELLLAATLTALVLGGAAASLSVVLRAYKELGGKAEYAETGRLMLERIRTDLVATYLSPHSDMTRFVCTNAENGDFSTDTLTFISRVNNPIESGGGTSDLAEIQYYIDVDDSTPEKWLLRRIDITPDDDPFTGGQIALLGPNAVYLDFQFFDGQEWLPAWDSESSIPIAINVTIGTFKPNYPGETPTIETTDMYSTMVWVASYRETTEEETEGGPSSG